MSTKSYEVRVTVTIDDVERDVTARALVSVEHGLGMGGAIGAEIDGQIRLYVNQAWTDLEDVALDASDVERITEALETAALEDDSSECIDHDDFARDCA